MYKQFTIIKRLGFSYSIAPFYRGLYLLPTFKLFGLSNKRRYWSELYFSLSFRFLFITISIHLNSQ